MRWEILIIPLIALGVWVLGTIFRGAEDERQKALRQRRPGGPRPPQRRPATEADAHRFGCNAVVVGKNVVLNAGCEALAAGLRAWGYNPIPVELDEFIKSGGSAKCLTLRLDGEEAAVWD